jgi:hypothetical protein
MTLRATFFFRAVFLAADFRFFDVVFFREVLFLAAICSSPDGYKITAALYIWEPDFKALDEPDMHLIDQVVDLWGIGRSVSLADLSSGLASIAG